VTLSPFDAAIAGVIIGLAITVLVGYPPKVVAATAAIMTLGVFLLVRFGAIT
jgi:uncharacterized membrane protein (Fun14 family)